MTKNLERETLLGVFRCFDANRSGGIDLEELQSAFSALGISQSKARVAEMFVEADTDGSGEIDFEEFCEIVHRGDGGALERMIRKVAEDKDVRDYMRERIRPSDRAGLLRDQLADLQQERQWMSRMHLNTVSATADAAKLGYHGDQSVFPGIDKLTTISSPPKASGQKKAVSSPTTVMAPPAFAPSPTKPVLNSRRTAHHMLPTDVEQTIPRLKESSSLTMRRPPASLRRVFAANVASPGRRMVAPPGVSPRDPHGRSTSQPAYRPPRPSFYEPGVIRNDPIGIMGGTVR